jgi:hypothetical protein
MPVEKFVDVELSERTLKVVEQANEIIATYQGQGYNLTLRQLYYQFVARDLMKNTIQNYKRLGSIVNDGRLGGLIDWDAIEDRTRGISGLSHWDSPADIMRSAAYGYRRDKWETQPVRVEVWVEKEALAGVFERVCQSMDVPLLSCRGYTSQSEMWRASKRLRRYADAGQHPVILHFGDHDPSGIDMSRDIQDRMKVFGADVTFERLALNMDQIEQYRPPPNPAKTTDSRFAAYMRTFGKESWELDALEPSVLSALAQTEIEAVRDADKWAKAVKTEGEEKALLEDGSRRWREVVGFLRAK